MKSITLILLLIAFPSVLFSQGNDLIVSDLHDPHILLPFFDSCQLINGMAVWKPNFAEEQDFNHSYDGLCHTNIDSVIVYDSSRKAVVILTTYEYDDSLKPVDYHASAPTVSTISFSKTKDNRWKFERFKKYLTEHGSWGALQPISLCQIGTKEYALQFDGGFTGQGSTEFYTTLYRVDDFQQIFRILSGENIEGGYGNERENYSWEKTLEFFPTKSNSDFYEIIVRTVGKGHKIEDDDTSPVVKLNKKQTYHFDYFTGRYELTH